MISRVLIYCWGLLFFVIFLVVSPDRIDTTFDQTNTGPPLGTVSQNLKEFSPLGQSFTPAKPSLNFVNLLTEYGSATVKLNIRSGSISGPIIGTSEATVIPPSSSPRVSSFRFAQPMSLTPGSLYVIEPIAVCGSTLIVSTGRNSYIGGTQILGGIAQTNTDLWFQEGTSSPARRAWLLPGAGLIAFVLLRNSSILPRLSRNYGIRVPDVA